jgi:hypothetical protein
MAIHQQQPTPHPGHRDTDSGSKRSRVVRPDDDKRTGQPPPEDIERPEALPKGSTRDQIANMENEGQAQKHDNGR